MKLSANLIYDNLPPDLNAEFLGKRDAALHLQRPEMYEPPRDRFLNDHVYVLRGEELPQRPRIEPEALLVVLGDSVYLSRYAESCRVIHLRAPIRRAHAVNLLKRVYDTFDRWDDALQEILNTTASLSEMVSVSREIFDNPIVVLNASFHYLAHTDFSSMQLSELERQRWGGADSTGLPLATLNQFMELHELSTDVKGPLLLRLLDSTTLNVNLFENGEFAGCLSVNYRDRLYRPSDDALAVHLAKMMEYALRRYSAAADNDQSKLRQALQDLVDGYRVSMQQERVIRTSYLQQEHVCVRIKFRRPLVQLPVTYLCRAIEDEFRRSAAFEYEGSIVCFIEISSDQAADGSYRDLLEKHLTPLLRSLDSVIGISDPFADIFDARTYYLQANAALENGQLFRPGRGSYVFQDYALRELVINAVGNLPVDRYAPAGLRRILEHDKTSPVSYEETLRVYLDCCMSATRATEKLYINRSTLLERLGRIRRELGVDLEDPEERLRLQILLKARQLHAELEQNRE